jgi:DNA-binding NtrC family response regulator
MKSAKVLLVSIRKEIRDLFKSILSSYTLLFATELAAAVGIILKENLQLVLIDWQSDFTEREEAWARLLDYNKQSRLVVLDKHKLPASLLTSASQNLLVFWDLDAAPADMLNFMEDVLIKKNLQQENRRLLDRIEARYTWGDFIGRGNYYNLIIAKIEEYCRNREPVLIVGESGTEKDIIAYEIFRNATSNNCSFKKYVLMPGMLDDISFIYQSANGYLVLDDIGLLAEEDQQKLKALLNEPLVNLRYILFSTVPLEKKVRAGKFDADLYRQIAATQIDLLPLRERIKDLPDIADNYLQVINETNNFSISGLSDEALLIMSRYDWPGNTAQLHAVLSQICYAQRKGEIKAEHLPLFLSQKNEAELLTGLAKLFPKI